jgi:hypothetical protein
MKVAFISLRAVGVLVGLELALVSASAQMGNVQPLSPEFTAPGNSPAGFAPGYQSQFYTRRGTYTPGWQAPAATTPSATQQTQTLTSDAPTKPFRNVTTDNYGNIIATDQQGNQIRLAGNNYGFTSDTGFNSPYMDSNGSVFARDSSGQSYLIYDNPRKVSVSSGNSYVGAVVDAYGNVYGVDSQGSRTLIYNNPNERIPGTGFQSAMADGQGGVYGVDSHGNKRLLAEGSGNTSAPVTAFQAAGGNSGMWDR